MKGYLNSYASVKIALSSQKEKVREKLSSVREEIERALSEGNFLPEFNESVLSPFKEIEKITEKDEDCALVQSQLSMINSCRTDAYERIDHEKPIIRQRPKKAPYGNEPETPAGPGTSPACPKGDPGSEPEAPPSTVTAQKRTTFITEISFFRSEKLIEGEEDVDAYIKNLKAKLMKILEEKNIRV